MTWKEIEIQMDYGKRNIVYITKPRGSSFYVYNYSGNSFINSLFGRLDIWAYNNHGGTPKLYKNIFEYYQFELPTELYETFKLNSMKMLFVREQLQLFLEEDMKR